MNSPFQTPPYLQEAWLRQLGWHFGQINYMYADRKLRRPIFLIGSGSGKLGEWNGLHRTITISENHILDHPWESVLETLRHEMAHQYVEEVMGLRGAPPHGEAFAEACRVLRVEPGARASTERLGPLAASDAERDKMLQRIKELLAMAGSPNENEAANAMRLVNKYLLKYNLDLAEVNRARSYSVRHFGQSSGRIQEYEYTLGHILQEHFFVQIVWTYSYDPYRNQPGRILQVAGTSENLEIAEYVYQYVINLTEPLWRAHRASGRAGGGTRLQYLAGLLRGLSEKLDRQRTDLKEEHGLVWKGDPGLRDYYRHLNPRLRTVGYGGVTRGGDYAAGINDGRRINIRRGVGGEGEAVRRGRLLE